MYTLTITPFEVGLDLPTRIDALFICNQLVSIIFLFDILVQFFTPFPAPWRGEGAYERNRLQIAKKYLRSWFVLDFIATFPVRAAPPMYYR